MSGPITMTPQLLAAALAVPPTPVRHCHRCESEHWRCVWCLRHDEKTRSGRGGKVLPSGWEQLHLVRAEGGQWATLCTRCAAKRMRNPWNALLGLRIRGTGEPDVS